MVKYLQRTRDPSMSLLPVSISVNTIILVQTWNKKHFVVSIVVKLLGNVAIIYVRYLSDETERLLIIYFNAIRIFYAAQDSLILACHL
jgi:hypothetical protein